MEKKQSLAYGSWSSPISAEMVASSGSGSSALPREVQVDKTGVYWIEARPEEGGRYVIQHRHPSGKITTSTPTGYSVRTRVHEYGGGDYLLGSNGAIFFSNESDQRIYRHDQGTDPAAITPEPEPGEQIRFANGCMRPNGLSIVYVCEKHSTDGEVMNFLVDVASDGSRAPVTLHHGHDFYANPRVSPDGKQLLWLTWDHPQMPWDGTDLWHGMLEDQQLLSIKHIAGGSTEAIFQPEWSPLGEMYYVSDRTGWWNIYRKKGGSEQALTNSELEFGTPLWMLSYQSYCFVQDDTLVALYKDKGRPGLVVIDTSTATIDFVDVDDNYFAPTIAAGSDGRVWFLSGSPFTFPGLSSLHVESRIIEREAEVLTYDIDKAYISIPEHISFPSPNGESAYAFFYPATHPTFQGLDHELPPLIVMGHGGPTAAVKPYLNFEIQFWTSRGFSIVDVDYSGSTGYGREYRERLRGQWGIADIADCVQAARHLGDIGLVDSQRLLITGGSAGGYIVLCALTHYDDFSAGASYYGVADILALAQETHKFEAMYDVSLIGPYPEFAETYYERSPIHYADNIKCPVILFQGLEDEVVPPAQSILLVKSLERNNIFHRYITFEKEGHGFRRSESIRASLEAELEFYREVLNIP